MHHLATFILYVKLKQAMRIRPIPFRDASLHRECFAGVKHRASVVRQERHCCARKTDRSGELRNDPLSHWNCLHCKNAFPGTHKTITLKSQTRDAPRRRSTVAQTIAQVHCRLPHSTACRIIYRISPSQTESSTSP